MGIVVLFLIAILRYYWPLTLASSRLDAGRELAQWQKEFDTCNRQDRSALAGP